MTEADHHQDLALAREICSELRSGNNEAILNIYNPYHHFFVGYTRRRVQSIDPDRASIILNELKKDGLDKISTIFPKSTIQTFSFQHQ